MIIINIILDYVYRINYGNAWWWEKYLLKHSLIKLIVHDVVKLLYYNTWFSIFSFVLLFFATQWTNTNQVFKHVLSCLLNVINIMHFEIGKLHFVKQRKVLANVIKTQKFINETHPQESLFEWSYMLEANNFIEKGLTVWYDFLETYFIEYLQAVPSKTTSRKACKFCIVYISYFCQQLRWLRGQNMMCIDEKKLHLIFWLQFYWKGIKPSLNYSVKSFNFSMWCRLYPPCQFVYGIQR